MGRRRHTETGTITGVTEVTAERVRLSGEILKAMAERIAADAKVHQRFMFMVLASLAKIQARLTEIQGCQVVQFWPGDRVTDAERESLVREVEARISKSGRDMGMRTIEFVVAGIQADEPQKKKRRRWADCPEYEI